MLRAANWGQRCNGLAGEGFHGGYIGSDGRQFKTDLLMVQTPTLKVEPGAVDPFPVGRPVDVSQEGSWATRRALAVRHPLLIVAYVLAATRLPHNWQDFGYLRQGSMFVLGTGPHTGLHLYANLPYLQIGPLSLLAVAGLALGWPFHELGAVAVLGGALLLATVRCAELAAFTGHTAAEQNKVRTVSLLATPALALGWADTMVNWGHVDDVLALTLLAAAWLACRRDRAVLCGVLVALATAAKPWALLGIALIFAVNDGKRRRFLFAAGAVSLAVWAPYAVADPHTLTALSRFAIDIQKGSLLHGFYGGARSPHWVRLGQLAGGLALAWMAARRQRPELILCLGLLARLVLDPGDFSYYTSELLFGVLLVELYRAPELSAWRATGIAVYLPWLVLNFDPFLIPSSLALCRAVVFAGATGYLAWELCWAPGSQPIRQLWRSAVRRLSLTALKVAR